MELQPLHEDDILRCDDAMMRWASERANLPYPPVVRASTYGGDLYARGRVYHKHFSNHLDPRIPVVMRGAKHIYRTKYSTKSSFGSFLVERFLQKIKFTSSNAKKRHAMRGWLIQKLSDKNIYMHFSTCPILPDWEKWVDGRKLLSNGEEMIFEAEPLPTAPPVVFSGSVEVTRAMRMRAAMLALDELGIKI